MSDRIWKKSVNTTVYRMKSHDKPLAFLESTRVSSDPILIPLIARERKIQVSKERSTESARRIVNCDESSLSAGLSFAKWNRQTQLFLSSHRKRQNESRYHILSTFHEWQFTASLLIQFYWTNCYQQRVFTVIKYQILNHEMLSKLYVSLKIKPRTTVHSEFRKSSRFSLH